MTYNPLIECDVYIKGYHGSYLCAERNFFGAMVCNRRWTLAWETFRSIPLANGKTAFRTYHRKHLCAEANGCLVGNRTWIKKWEWFTVHKLNNSKFAIQSYHGKYLSAQANGSIEINRSWIKKWERFDIVLTPREKEKIQQQEINELKRKQEEAQKKQQQQMTELHRQQQEAEILQKQQLTQQLNARKSDLLLQKQSIQKEYNINHEQLVCVDKQIMKEEKEIYNFAEERNDKFTKIIILMGNTGDGKSTFGNRLMGDTSEEADQGVFKTSDDNKSCTEVLQKYKYGKTSIVDAPGWNDYNGNDRTHVNNLCAFLKGCGGINVFVVVRNGSNCRFDADFQNKLKQFKNAFGDDFWMHLIVVLTHVDKGIAEKKFKKGNKVQQVKYDLSKLCGGLNANIPVIPIGLDNYDDKISKFMDAVPIQRFICDNIKSPIDDLKIKKQKFINQETKLKQRIQRIENTISEIESQINAL